ncbi:AAA family ATPase [Vibrio diabolicus]|uniref:AAA family ATPase n=1 Tax=Vibrio diabolicus TaxID=50719 RepID=UPI001243A387|nr:AAA family ATPase [Vibrio diabolicus]KAB0322336.1 AAA family ATPase [Vibrio diabolicus]
MSINRIKKVSFDSFRAFSGSLELDFEIENNIADIVVIYAPNGTGKTSAIEGIEWATTGKISRLDNIISRNNARNKNPKEGHILKNRQSSKKSAIVSIELENGSLIKRKTKPKQNRNNDYCEGIIESNVDYSNKFVGNILSQGTISKFSYEASSGELFKSLVSNKSSHKDIEVYDNLNELKNKLENTNTRNKNQIAYINEQIDIYTNEIKELEQDFIEDNSFNNSEEYRLFKENYSLYKDLSNKTFSEIVVYFTELSSSFESLKEKIITFDLSEFKRKTKEQLLASKIMHLDGRVLDKNNDIRVLERRQREVQKEKESIDLFLEPSNMATINGRLNLHSEINKELDTCVNDISKLVNIKEKIRLALNLMNLRFLLRSRMTLA